MYSLNLVYKGKSYKNLEIYYICKKFPHVYSRDYYKLRRDGQLVISFGATKPPAHPEDGDGVSCPNVVELSHPEAAVCLRKCH